MAAQTLWSEFLGRLLLGATLAGTPATLGTAAGRDPAPAPERPHPVATPASQG